MSSLVLLVTVAFLAGCATPVPLPPARTLQAGDVKSLAGEWEGSATGTRSPGGGYGGPGVSGRVTVKEDGTFTSNMGGVPGVGTFRIVDGKVAYEGSTMRGIATLYGSGAQEVLKGEGTLVGIDGQSGIELRRR
jgi:hypothetical protein